MLFRNGPVNAGAVAARRDALREFVSVYVVLVLIVITLQSLSNPLFFLREVTYLSAPHHDLWGACKSLGLRRSRIW